MLTILSESQQIWIKIQRQIWVWNLNRIQMELEDLIDSMVIDGTIEAFKIRGCYSMCLQFISFFCFYQTTWEVGKLIK
jgi:hypothetical protein